MGDSFDVKKWIRFAVEDLDSASVLANKYRPHIQVACFLCQQSAEKILKAYIIAKGLPFTKTHDLSFLKNQCLTHDPEFDNYDLICNTLKAYVGAGRYPQSMDITEHHMKKALQDAEKILVFTRAKLKELGYEYDPDEGVTIIADSDKK